MTGRFLLACGLVLVLAAPGPARAGEVRLLIKDGRVTLSARDATLREILIEWERVGGTKIVNRDRVPGTPITIEMADVPEARALATLLRPIAGYMAARRLGPEGGASEFSRVILMPGAAAPLSAGPAAPAQASAPAGQGGSPAFTRPGMQRRVLPDGRVVTVMDDPQRQTDPNDDADEADAPPAGAPGLSRPPFPMPQRVQPGQAGNDPSMPEGPEGQATPGTTVAPVVPVTIPKPGVVPAVKPGAQAPPGPPKPPGDEP